MHEPTCVHTYLLLLAACKGAPLVIHLEQTVNRGLGEQAVQSVLSYPHTQVLSQLSIINHSSIYIPFSSWESRSLLKCVRSPTYIRTQVSEETAIHTSTLGDSTKNSVHTYSHTNVYRYVQHVRYTALKVKCDRVQRIDYLCT